MIVNLPNGFSIKWNGSHTANVYSPEGIEVDCFSFSYEKNRVSQLDFTSALESYLDYFEGTHEVMCYSEEEELAELELIG